MAAFTSATNAAWAKTPFIQDELANGIRERWAACYTLLHNDKYHTPRAIEAGDGVQGLMLLAGQEEWPYAAWPLHMQSAVARLIAGDGEVHGAQFRFVDAEGEYTGAHDGSAFAPYTIESFCTKIGLPFLEEDGELLLPERMGWRRTKVHPDDPAFADFEYGPMEDGDIIGWWIFEDLQKALCALCWTLPVLWIPEDPPGAAYSGEDETQGFDPVEHTGRPMLYAEAYVMPVGDPPWPTVRRRVYGYLDIAAPEPEDGWPPPADAVAFGWDLYAYQSTEWDESDAEWIVAAANVGQSATGRSGWTAPPPFIDPTAYELYGQQTRWVPILKWTFTHGALPD
jgi:hypothetical protein